MKKFDTNVQQLKYEILKELIKKYDNNDISNSYRDIPEVVVNDLGAVYSDSIEEEKAIIKDKLTVAMGGDTTNPNSVEVVKSACDECPHGGVYVTPACRGCVMHKCAEVCPKNAITIVDHKATVDKTKCISCGLCTKACPYSAIILNKRPCIESCNLDALSVGEDKKAKINNDKCISCGACVYACPFGAIQDKSHILEALDILKNSKDNQEYKVYAVIAPAIAGQFDNAKTEQVVTALKKLGFYGVVEAALGADITLFKETEEVKEKGQLTSSCCPSFVMYIEKHFKELVPYISTTHSPMIYAGLLIKNKEPNAKTIFIGPCTSKKVEYQLEKTKNGIDMVITFEELQALLDARDIDVSSLEETEINDASFYGRIFAKSGGLTEGVAKVSKDYFGMDNVTTVTMSGIKECKPNLMKLKLGKAQENFFEGMACEGGCLNGAACIHHRQKNKMEVEKFGRESKENDVSKGVKEYTESQKHDEA